MRTKNRTIHKNHPVLNLRITVFCVYLSTLIAKCRRFYTNIISHLVICDDISIQNARDLQAYAISDQYFQYRMMDSQTLNPFQLSP